MVERYGHVHAEEVGDERDREEDHGQHGQHLEDTVLAVADRRLVRLLECLGDLLVVLEEVPDALGGVDEVVVVDVEVLAGEVALTRALELAEHGTLRFRDLAVGDDLLLDVRDHAHDRLIRIALEEVILDVLELAADLVEDGEAVAVERVEHLVEEKARALGEPLGALFLVGLKAAEDVADRLERDVRDRDEKVGPDEGIHFGGKQATRLLVVPREVEHHKDVVGVLVDLRSLSARADILKIELVEGELLLKPGDLSGAGGLQLDPAQSTRLEHADARLHDSGSRHGHRTVPGSSDTRHTR